jgi:hypothetical protein
MSKQEVIMKTKWAFLLVVLVFLYSVSVSASQTRFRKIVVDKTFGAYIREAPARHFLLITTPS